MYVASAHHTTPAFRAGLGQKQIPGIFAQTGTPQSVGWSDTCSSARQVPWQVSVWKMNQWAAVPALWDGLYIYIYRFSASAITRTSQGTSAL